MNPILYSRFTCTLHSYRYNQSLHCYKYNQSLHCYKHNQSLHCYKYNQSLHYYKYNPSESPHRNRSREGLGFYAAQMQRYMSGCWTHIWHRNQTDTITVMLKLMQNVICTIVHLLYCTVTVAGCVFFTEIQNIFETVQSHTHIL